MSQSQCSSVVTGLVAAALICAAPASASAQAAPPAPAVAQTPVAPNLSTPVPARFEPVRQAILEVMTQANVPSIAVAVVEDGRIVWEQAFGWADRERQIAATAHTAYSVASMTKPITATAVMALRDAGRIDIDAPVERYLGGARLGGISGAADQVTARRIMAHSAGLPQFGLFRLDGSAPADATETISNFGLVVFPPNTRFEYSNIGMRILDVAIEQASGQSYGDYLSRAVFGPLGMADSAVGLPSGNETAVRYDNEREPMRFYLTDHPGSGDVWASAHDMGRFLAFHLAGPASDQATILSDATRLEMQRPASAAPMSDGPGSARRDVGANWIISSSNGHPQIWHSGGQPGVSSVMAFFPEQGVGFVLLANSSAPLGPIGQAIRQAVAPELLEPESPRVETPPTLIPFTGVWRGTVTSHVGDQPLSLTFGADGQVTAAFAGQPAAPLSRTAYEDGALTGVLAGQSDLPEAAAAPHRFALRLVEADGELVGQLVAQGMNDDVVFMLPSFVRLRPAGDS
ncbi:serine hydrolase domain-containing protein [Brevundimonas sp. 2R-24]|uniref:Serine hydrolase domain-containing protein n=1 Tax=Peiella sedimenti TaxID=3061083 RepID=A0ABT8SPI2_9CAUL|nr:serine hydrolase domain-containing protein [Caulobacteraceae bacterium XZ-24]